MNRRMQSSPMRLPTTAEIRFCLGSKIFCYDRLGLSIVAE